MKIPFTLDAWLKDKSQKIETRNGRPVHYIGLDRAGWQVFEIFRTNGTSEYKTYHDSYLYSGPGESTFDLFLVTSEEELTPLEDCLSTYLKNDFEYFSTKKWDEKKWNDTMRIQAAELLKLAREQIIKDGYVIEKKAFHDAVEKIDGKNKAEMSIQYSLHCKVENGTRHAVMNWEAFQKVAQKFIDIGKAEALKDLPRWRKWEYGAGGNGQGIPLAIVKRAPNSYKLVDALGLPGEQYIMLSDLEKLPGFNENITIKIRKDMTQEEKQLLLKDLCARLPYWPNIKIEDDDDAYLVGLDNTEKGLFSVHIIEDGDDYDTTMSVEDFKPYLRPMSSMTKEEKKEYESFIFTQHHEWDGHGTSIQYVETDDVERYFTWLNKKGFDYRGLIKKGIALEAPEGMYK